MSKPNFLRLKRKVKEKPQPSVSNPPTISQKTISSFFAPKKTSANLDGNAKDGSSVLDSHENPKRFKLEDDSNVTTLQEKLPVKLSDSIISKLKNFSSSSGVDTDMCSVQRPCTKSVFDGCSNLPSVMKAPKCDEEEEGSSRCNLDSFRALSQVELKCKSSATQVPKTSKIKNTPLEQQVIDLWAQHPGVLLAVECGYKYRFFGNDAEIAAQELNIIAHMDHNFMTASIPVHRLHAHIGRLVEKGHKVGVVKQLETAALKAMSDNKSAPFTRKLMHLFTCATLIGEDVDSIDHENLQSDGGIASGHIFCLSESQTESKTTNMIFVSVNPSTGESTYEQFSDNPSREELHKRFQIIKPAEILSPPGMSADTERLLNHSKARLEKLPSEWFETTDALTRIVRCFATANDKSESTALDWLTDVPPPVLGCMAALLQHLYEFGLHRAIRPDSFQVLLSGQDYLHIDSSTIHNLQLFTSDGEATHGSLFWALNHTKTKFGARLLHKWLAQPVRVQKTLEDRQNSISELLGADEVVVSMLKNTLSSLPDIEKGLTTVLYNKCNPMQFLSILEALCMMRTGFSSLHTFIESESSTPLLQQSSKEIVTLLDDIEPYKENINVTAAKEGDKTKLLKDFSDFPNVLKLMDDIKNTVHSLNEFRPEIAQKLSLFSVQYTCVSGQEYLVEVKNTTASRVPGNWRKISCTKQVSRYRPPAVDRLFGELQRLREMLRAECQLAWIGLLQDFSQQYFKYKQAIHKVATIDVVLSLAHVAQQESYCRPTIVDEEEPQIIIKRGRHPVVPLLFPSAGQFVPNDTHLDSSEECCMVLSGPNMGGKSCYIRQVALIALLAHIGSYVPADYAKISLLDSILTRMGARDELFNGRSTLMVELEETAAILKKVTKRSLILLDELGRGTGSCDGSAIACATLRHISLEVQCLSLFVTHYPSVMDTANELDGKASNYHMAFVLHNQGEAELLTFLYEVVKGAADRSYGINVARLANLDRCLLQRAAAVAEDLEKEAKHRRDIRQSFVGMWNK